MNLKVGDKVKPLTGDYRGLTLRVKEVGEGIKNHYVLLSNNRWYHLTMVKKA